MQEEWVDVFGYEGLYQVSNTGLVRSCDRTVKSAPKVGSRIAKGSARSCHLNGNGYLTVGLWKDGVGKTTYVHFLVSRAFLGECPDSYDVNHKDGIKTNNCVSNLEYCTRSQNLKHAYATGLRGAK
jgi:hypothetical protein